VRLWEGKLNSVKVIFGYESGYSKKNNVISYILFFRHAGIEQNPLPAYKICLECTNIFLKGQCHEIFDHLFFIKTSVLGP
jgi:hypothetical protein